jgi:hypothetical protein
MSAQFVSNSASTGMSLNNADINILQANVIGYKAAAALHGVEKKEARKATLLTVHDGLKALHPTLTKAEWEEMKMV